MPLHGEHAPGSTGRGGTGAVRVWPEYADYQAKTDRTLPIFVLERTSAPGR